MSEPTTVAQEIEVVVPGIFWWWIEDERLGGHISAAHAVSSEQGAVLIDPLPLAPAGMERLPTIAAIVCTSGSHQRSSWRLRRETGASVWMPASAQEIDEEPDERYGEGDELPAGLGAIFTPGAGTTQHTLFLDDRVAFVPDLLTNPPGGELALVPEQYMHDPEQARQSLGRILDELSFDVLCLSHGLPLTEDPAGSIRTALAAA